MNKLLIRKLGLLIICGIISIPGHAQVSDSLPDNELKQKNELFPNISGKGMMTPTGWGGAGAFGFGFVAATFPQVYTSKPDMVAGAGIGVGNSYKTVGVVGIINMLDLSSQNTFSASLIASRHIGRGTSMSIGGLNLLASKRSDADISLYLALSHASQRIKSKTPGYSGLSYTIGVGSGRFYDKSLKDFQTGKGAHGTAVFANLSYELAKNFNIIAEWSGLNLDFALSWRPSFLSSLQKRIYLPSLSIGLADLTRNSGDRVRFIISLGQSFSLSKQE